MAGLGMSICVQFAPIGAKDAAAVTDFTIDEERGIALNGRTFAECKEMGFFFVRRLFW
jgi:hypothetical protein